MDKKMQLLQILENSPDYVSGSELAESLGVTRAAVWKYIRALEAEGAVFEAVTNRGYRLSAVSDVITAEAVERGLGDLAGHIPVEVVSSCASTNMVLKERAPGLPEWYTLISGSQSAGRGRLGRSFYSPPGTGLYMSVLLRPKLTPEDTALITSAAAVAAAGAIEEVSGEESSIKWVNDVYVRGLKVCGILTEASFDLESGGVEHAVMGIGINVAEPEGGFPPELRDIAGAVLTERCRNVRSALAAAFLRRFRAAYGGIPSRGFVEEYRRRSFLIGQKINVLRLGSSRPAVALAVDGNCHLIVRYEDGTEESLSSGEVSVRKADV